MNVTGTITMVDNYCAVCDVYSIENHTGCAFECDMCGVVIPDNAEGITLCDNCK